MALPDKINSIPPAMRKSSLSAGEIVREVLMESPVGEMVRKIYPVATPEARLPYILYRRASMETARTKGGPPRADAVTLEVVCYTERYGEGVALAEAVRETLDGVAARNEEMEMRSCVLCDAEEYWEDDAFVQHLTFEARITGK